MENLCKYITQTYIGDNNTCLIISCPRPDLMFLSPSQTCSGQSTAHIETYLNDTFG